MKFDEKQCKNNEKIMKRFGSRTSTLARGLRPIHPGYYTGETQRGNKKGTHGKKMEKRKMKKIISINFNFKCFKTMYVYKPNEQKRKFQFFFGNIFFIFLI